jgi:ribosomal-protein-alanine N-acetyltransferase
VIVLETPRLILRKFCADDIEPLCLLYADAEVRRYFPDGVLDPTQTKEELDLYLEGGFAEDAGLGLWATIHRMSGRFIGRCGLIPWSIDGRCEVEIAYLLGREFWRQGLGVEAAAALVRHGFNELRLARLIALIHPMNTASIRTAERVGLRFERSIEINGAVASLYAIHTGDQQ